MPPADGFRGSIRAALDLNDVEPFTSGVGARLVESHY
jgi:hypothetical protein